jgi:hypothetical protein
MNAGIDIQMVRERYQRMTDEELIRIATHDAFGLTPEALEVVKAEIRKRNLQLGEEIIQKTSVLLHLSLKLFSTSVFDTYAIS